MPQPDLTGPWSIGQIEEFLQGAVIPLRLSTINPNGWPIVLSLWFLYEDGVLWAASRGTSRIVSFLKAHARCGFEIAGETAPYFGVRGYGVASIAPDTDARLLKRLSARYLGPAETPFRDWLLDNAEDEMMISIVPRRMMTWDYRARMTRTD